MDEPVDLVAERKKRNPNRAVRTKEYLDKWEEKGMIVRNDRGQRTIQYDEPFKQELLELAIEHPSLKLLCAATGASKPKIYAAGHLDPDWLDDLRERMRGSRLDLVEDFFTDAVQGTVKISQPQFMAGIAMARRADNFYRDNPNTAIQVNVNVSAEKIGAQVDQIYKNEALMRDIRNGGVVDATLVEAHEETDKHS